MLKYICDKQRHLICLPYSIANLHLMAKQMKIHKYWFHKNHYDIPENRILEIKDICNLVSPKTIVRIIRGQIKILQDYHIIK